MEEKTNENTNPKELATGITGVANEQTKTLSSVSQQQLQYSIPRPSPALQATGVRKGGKTATEGEATGPGTGYCSKCRKKCNGAYKMAGMCSRCSGNRKNQKKESDSKCRAARRKIKEDLNEQRARNEELEAELEVMRAQLLRQNAFLRQIRECTLQPRGLAKIRKLFDETAPENVATGVVGPFAAIPDEVSQASEHRSEHSGDVDDTVRRRLVFSG